LFLGLAVKFWVLPKSRETSGVGERLMLVGVGKVVPLVVLLELQAVSPAAKAIRTIANPTFPNDLPMHPPRAVALHGASVLSFGKLPV
jgi:hypothetical protein